MTPLTPTAEGRGLGSAVGGHQVTANGADATAPPSAAIPGHGQDCLPRPSRAAPSTRHPPTPPPTPPPGPGITLSAGAPHRVPPPIPVPARPVPRLRRPLLRSRGKSSFKNTRSKALSVSGGGCRGRGGREGDTAALDMEVTGRGGGSRARGPACKHTCVQRAPEHGQQLDTPPPPLSTVLCPHPSVSHKAAQPAQTTQPPVGTGSARRGHPSQPISNPPPRLCTNPLCPQQPHTSP